MDTTQAPKKRPLNQRLRQLAAYVKTRFNGRGHCTEEAAFADGPKTASDNPYLAARQEWNLMFGDIIKAKYNWQRIAFFGLSLNVLLVIGFIALSLQSRYVAYAVKVDGLGDAAFAGYLQKTGPATPVEVNAFVRRYISDVRSVIADPVAQKTALGFVYATSTQKTADILNVYYRQNNPFKTAQLATVEIQINGNMPKSDKTWQINWTEVQRDSDGAIVGTTHWEALVTVGQHTLSDARALNINPLGLFVEHISWSQQF